jgi:hypothetical protein
MLTAPFFIISAYIVRQALQLCKLVALLPFNSLDRSLDLAKHHLGYVAGRAAELHDRIEGVEVENILEYVLGEYIRIQSQPAEHHKGYAIGQGIPKYYAHIQLIQTSQIAAVSRAHELGEIIRHIVLNSVADDVQQLVFKSDGRFIRVPELVRQLLSHLLLMRFFHVPQPERSTIQAVRIRHVENMPECRCACAVVQKCNALCATVHPAAHMLVPQLDGSTGGGVRALCINEDLLLERIFVQAGSGLEKGRPCVRFVRYPPDGLFHELGYTLQLGRHRFSPPHLSLY